MQSSEIRSRFLKFFKKRGHAILESASLVTSDEKTGTNQTLFNTAGVQPLIPYLLGEPHPKGRRLAAVQKCLRTVDIDDVGDKTHATFFEMMGNWSLGDYFKDEAIGWSYEFLTGAGEGLGLDPKRLYITVFRGDDNAPKDTEAAAAWQKAGMPENRIYFRDAASNWWPAVRVDRTDDWTGPTGPCTEMFYDISDKPLGDLSPADFEKADNDQKVVEIWNDVFMEYEKRDGRIVGKLKQKNVDTGAGLERLAAVLEGVDNIFDTDLQKPLLEIIRKHSEAWDLVSARIVADHVKAAVFLIADDVESSNTDRGYVLRRLLRQAIVRARTLEMPEKWLTETADAVIELYAGVYENLSPQRMAIHAELYGETARFKATLERGLKEFDKISEQIKKDPSQQGILSGRAAFDLYQSYGFPLELTRTLAKEKGLAVNEEGFKVNSKEHQRQSRDGSEKRFKGGLADLSEMTVRYHTATHLLHQALHDVLGGTVRQKGSNITPERLRFDFSHKTRLTDEEKRRIEEIVNGKINEALPVVQVTMPIEAAKKTGARHFFGEKYGQEVSIYFIGQTLESAYSKEFCGGPHVANTRELSGPEGKWRFKIVKEEAVGEGVRRLKAVLL
jgi:alanyl-tRNA synthetase